MARKNWLFAIGLLTASTLAIGVAPASAVTPLWPHAVVGGFSVPAGDAFELVFADGSVRPKTFGDAFSLRLGIPVIGGAADPAGAGYWEVAADGNVFSYGSAGRFGGLGGIALNQPVFGMAATKSGKGYWLVARDGGIFTFGDAPFHGSAGSLRLHQPIVGITTDPSGKGYRLVARDGGIFSFGKIAFAGSLPGRRVRVRDVVGMASTPTGNGYWIARSDGEVYAFGDAQPFGSAGTSACDRFTAIIGNPVAPGYRLVTASGRTVAFGAAPGGTLPTGTPRICGRVTAHIELPATTIAAGATMTGHLVVDNETRAPLRLRDAQGCQPGWAVGLSTSAIPNRPLFALSCGLRPLTFPVGETQYAFAMAANYVVPPVACGCVQLLPPGQYSARFFDTGGAFPPVASIPVTVVAPT